MRFSHIKSLVEVDLLQSNRQMSTGDRAQGMKKKNIYWRLLLQNGAVILLFVFLFGALISNVPLAEFPGIFSETIGFMIIFSMLQIYQLIYSLFYDDANLSAHLSLPYSLTELFTSKTVTIFLTTFAYFVSPLVLIVLLGWQTGHSLFFSIPVGLLSTALIMAGTVLTIFLVLHFLHQWSFFKNHKKIFMIGIYILFFVFIFTSIYSNDVGEAVPGARLMDSEINPLFVGFHEIFIPGLRLNGWLKIGLWLFVVLLFAYMVFKWVIPQLYFDDDQPVSKTRTKKQAETSYSLKPKWQVFVKYQLRQLTDTTLILQMLFSKFYIPFIMIAPVLFNDAMLDLSILEMVPHLWGTYLIVGLTLSFIMITETSISGVIISFDKENFNHLQSLPLSFRGYLKLKFYFAFLIEWLLGAALILGVSIYIGVPVLAVLLLLVGYTIGTYANSLYYYMRDYRLLDLTWNNFNELMQRGISQAVRIFLQIIIIFIGIFAIGAFLFWFVLGIQETTRLLISIGTVVVSLLIAFGFYHYAKKKFWSQFNA